MPSRHPTRSPVLALLLLLPLVLLACASTGGGTDPGATTGTAPSANDAWVRPPLAEGLPAAGYLTLTGSASDDRLIAVATSSADRVELHRSMAGDGGMMGMEPVDGIPIEAGATVRLEPGGLHLMLFGFDATASTVELRLTFESGATLTVPAEVRPG